MLPKRLMAPAVLVLAACAPALDWRESRPEGSQVRMMFPCKPAGHARNVQLAGAMVEISMFACTAEGMTFALTFADLKDPSLVAPALAALTHAAQAHLRPTAPAASQPVAVPGMTPNPLAAQWRLQGALPDGRTVRERAALFAYGASVYQVTMVGVTLDPQAEENFFGAVRVSR